VFPIVSDCLALAKKRQKKTLEFHSEGLIRDWVSSFILRSKMFGLIGKEQLLTKKVFLQRKKGKREDTN